MRNALPIPDAIAAYAAGFFDGEGHIQIVRHSRRGSWMLKVSLTQATAEPLMFFQEHFGGTLGSRIVPYKMADQQIEPKGRYEWQASSGVAERFLRRVLPYLQVKGDEAELALEFRATFWAQKRSIGFMKLPPEILNKRLYFAEQLKTLRKNKRETALRRLQGDVHGTPCETCVAYAG